MVNSNVEWREGEKTFSPRQVKIEQVKSLPNGKEVSTAYVCDVNALNPEHPEWIDLITSAPYIKVQCTEMLDCIVALYENLLARDPSPCVKIPENCQFCNVIALARLKDVLKKCHDTYRRL